MQMVRPSRDIKDSFNQRGIRTSQGNEFTYSSFDVMLSNRKYIGEYRYQDVVIPNGIPAIVDMETFERVQARRKKNKVIPAAAKAKEKYLLTTKLFCGMCGKMMAGESGVGAAGKYIATINATVPRTKRDATKSL